MTCFVLLARAYGGLGSLVFCSSINKLCCCSTSMYNDSKQFIIFPLLHAFNNCMICSGLPYSCLFLRICNAYAERGLLVFIYRICSRSLISIDLPVWPTYNLLHVLHCNIHTSLAFISFCGDLSLS